MNTSTYLLPYYGRGVGMTVQIKQTENCILRLQLARRHGFPYLVDYVVECVVTSNQIVGNQDNRLCSEERNIYSYFKRLCSARSRDKLADKWWFAYTRVGRYRSCWFSIVVANRKYFISLKYLPWVGIFRGRSSIRYSASAVAETCCGAAMTIGRQPTYWWKS